MRAILKARWWLMGLWVVVAAVLMFTAPNMSELIREKGQFSVRKDTLPPVLQRF